MIRVGIEKLDLYAGRMMLDAVALGLERGRDRAHLTEQVMVGERSVYPPFEDAVTLAVNAARRLLSPEDLAAIELLVVGSESGVDFGKPISTWVHRFCELSPNCRNFEVKHACYGGTAALKTAAQWVASGVRPGKKALVISTDITRPALETGMDFAAGGCAVAMLVSDTPRVLEIDLDKAGYWTCEIADTFRPTARVETGDNQTSLFSYLDALDGALSHYEELAGPLDYNAAFRRHIYHAPFPGMTLQAHRTLLERSDNYDREGLRASFAERVAPGLAFARRVGTAYGASNFVCLLGLLHSDPDLRPGDRIALFSYGSGCQGEFYGATVGPHALEDTRARAIDRHLDQRLLLTTPQYEANERAREAAIDQADHEPARDLVPGAYERVYQDRGLLVLQRVEQFYRHYAWS